MRLFVLVTVLLDLLVVGTLAVPIFQNKLSQSAASLALFVEIVMFCNILLILGGR